VVGVAVAAADVPLDRIAFGATMVWSWTFHVAFAFEFSFAFAFGFDPAVVDPAASLPRAVNLV